MRTAIGHRDRAPAVAAGVVGVAIVIGGALVGVSRLHSSGLGSQHRRDAIGRPRDGGPHPEPGRRRRPRWRPGAHAPGTGSSTASTAWSAAPTTGPVPSPRASTAAPVAAAPPKVVPKTVEGAVAPAPGAAPGNGNTIFSDNFAGSSLSSAWTVISRHGEYAQRDGVQYCRVRCGVGEVLSIDTIAQTTSCGDRNLDGSVRHSAASWPYLTGDVQWSSFNFTYGTVSIRGGIQPRAPSTWPAFWLLTAVVRRRIR